MKRKENKKPVGWGYLLLGLMIFAAGVLLVVYPSRSITAFCYIIGITALITGLVLAVRIITMEKRGIKFAFSVISALFIIACAVASLVSPQTVFRIFPSLFGLFVIIDASFKLSSVIRIRRYEMKTWWFTLVTVLLCICGGFLCIRYDTSVSVRTVSLTLGLTFAADGILNVVALFLSDRLTQAEKAAFSTVADSTVQSEDDSSDDTSADL